MATPSLCSPTSPVGHHGFSSVATLPRSTWAVAQDCPARGERMFINMCLCLPSQALHHTVLPAESPSPDPLASPRLKGQSIFLVPQIFVSGPTGLRAGKESRILTSSMAQRWPKTLLYHSGDRPLEKRRGRRG